MSFRVGTFLFSVAFAAWNGFGASLKEDADTGDSAQNAFVRVRGGGVRRVNGRDFVVTGGVVRVEANPGWQLLSPSVLKLGKGEPVSYQVRDYSGENTPGGNIDEERTETTETHVSAPRIAAKIDCKGPWVYAAPQTQVDFANAVFEGTLVTNGVHRQRIRTYRNGILESEEVRYVAIDPNRWTWDWKLGPTQGSQWGESFSRHLSNVTAGVYVVTGAVTAVNTACEKCQASATAKKNLIVSELSVTCDAYIGQDRTGDPAKPYKSPSVTAVAHLTPENPAVTGVDWTYRGGCEQSRNSGMSLELWTTNREYASSRYFGELVRAKYKTVSVSTNFTVVKIDVSIDSVTEAEESKKGALLLSPNDSRENDYSRLVPVSFSCQPKVKDDELVRIICSSNFLFKEIGSNLIPMKNLTVLPVKDLNTHEFYVKRFGVSQSRNDKMIGILHENSWAMDELKATLIGFDGIKVSCDEIPSSAEEFFEPNTTDFGHPESQPPLWWLPGTYQNPSSKAFKVFYKYIRGNDDRPKKFDIKLRALITPQGIEDDCEYQWRIENKSPDGDLGSLNRANAVDAIIRNPQEGGLLDLKCEIKCGEFLAFGMCKILLPRAGGEIKDWIINEVPISINRASVWADNVCRVATERGLKVNDFLETAWKYIASSEFDYQGIVGNPTKRYSFTDNDRPAGHEPDKSIPGMGGRKENGDWDEPSYATLCGVVVSRSKLNNLMYAVWGRTLGYSQMELSMGAWLNAISRWESDDDTSQAAIEIGGAWYDEYLSKLTVTPTQKEAHRMQTMDNARGLNDVNLWPDLQIVEKGFVFPNVSTNYNDLIKGDVSRED